jgi:F420-0:gamma-glutamyl ligase
VRDPCPAWFGTVAEMNCTDTAIACACAAKVVTGQRERIPASIGRGAAAAWGDGRRGVLGAAAAIRAN